MILVHAVPTKVRQALMSAQVLEELKNSLSPWLDLDLNPQYLLSQDHEHSMPTTELYIIFFMPVSWSVFQVYILMLYFYSICCFKMNLEYAWIEICIDRENLSF